jgi:hypothetical protein
MHVDIYTMDYIWISGLVCSTFLHDKCNYAFTWRLNTPQNVQLFLRPISETISSMVHPYNVLYETTRSGTPYCKEIHEVSPSDNLLMTAQWIKRILASRFSSQSQASHLYSQWCPRRLTKEIYQGRSYVVGSALLAHKLTQLNLQQWREGKKISVHWGSHFYHPSYFFRNFDHLFRQMHLLQPDHQA